MSSSADLTTSGFISFVISGRRVVSCGTTFPPPPPHEGSPDLLNLRIYEKWQK